MSSKSASDPKPVSIREVAKHAGVSPGTVSNVMNSTGYVHEKTRAKVLEAAKALNYIPNRAGRILKANRTNLIMLAVPDTTREIFFDMINQVQAILKENGYALLLCCTDASEDEEMHVLTMLQEQVFDGLILVQSSFSDRFKTAVCAAGRPIVLISMCSHPWAGTDAPFDTVSVDIYNGVLEAVRHLIRMGHSRIGFLSGSKSLKVNEQCEKAWLDAHKEAGIDCREYCLRRESLTQEGGYTAGRSLYMMKERPTAIFASDDLQAIGCREAILDEGGSVPGDIALAGSGNTQTSRILGITSLDLRAAEMGAHAARLLLDHLKNDSRTRQDLFFKPKLQIRESTLYTQTR